MNSMHIPRRFLFVDGLRGVAATWVVLFHAYKGGHLPNLAATLPDWLLIFLFQWGKFGVAIFFVLSGFVIAHSLRDAAVTPGYLVRFMARRSIRLDPPYFASIILVLALAFVSAKVKHEEIILPKPQVVAAHLVYLQDLLGMEQISDVFWTLCYEIQFYLVLCILLGLSQFFGRKGRAIVFIPAAIVSLIWGLGIITQNPIQGLFVNLWYGFLLGVFSYWAWAKKIPKAWFTTYAAVILASAVYRVDKFAIVCVSTATLLFICGETNRMEHWLKWRWIQFFGLVSYSLYLIHNPITGASFFLLKKKIPATTANEYLMLCIAVGICLATAFVMWFVVERPFIKLSRHVKLQPRNRACQDEIIASKS
ncbi:Acyltransferase family protein [Roseimaritima multifibrata]|uniref:Acyltransferase family protein n=1 Tax=Roseimaritima multifibrata TaxID=1930274 RepID=A0A517MMI1_9BACT|nr:acyltransferase [Roseimaritima multifibrata]QDS96099.1 Acyltransferase family protein [Roseimaritima multifibrata]